MRLTRRQVVEATRSHALVAAASALALDGTSWRTFRLGDTRWQEEAWRHYDICGELRYAANWMGNAISRCRFYLAELDPSGKPGDEVTDPSLTIVSETMFGGPASKAEASRQLGVQLYVAGESFVVAEEVASANKDIWYIVSTSEIRRQGGRIVVDRSHTYGGGKHELRPGRDLLIRTWTPHPRRYDAADSSVRPALPVLRELEQLTKKVFAQIDSRLAGAGLLFLPEEVQFPSADDEPAQDATGLMKQLERAMSAALLDQSAASALVPIMVQVAGEYIDKIKWLTFETPFQAETQELRSEAIRRLALALDMPAEVLLGQGDTNHWSAWQIEESTIKIQIEPLLARIADALTTAYLRPALSILGKDPDAYTLWYDTSALVIRPDRQADALALADKGILGDLAVRAAGNWSEDDAPTDDERIRKLASQLVLVQPTLIANKDIQQALGVEWDVEPTAAGAPPPPPEPASVEPPARRRALPSQPTDTTTPAQEAALLTGADMVVRRALELGGKRLLTRGFRGQFAHVPVWELHTHIDCTAEEAATHLAGAWEPARVLAVRLGMDPDVMVEMLSTYTVSLMAHGEPHDYGRFTAYLQQALELVGHDDCGDGCLNPLHPGPCATETFHLPGRHNQKDHGRKRVRTATTPPSTTPTPAPAPPAPAAGTRTAARSRTPATTPAAPLPAVAGGPVAVRKVNDPQVQAVLDVIYGADPKSRNAGRQFDVYGKLRKNQFDTELTPPEQSVLLGDLAYVVTTSKSANARGIAQKMIDRFTPPGTPPGQVHKQAIIPPANAVPNQVRLSTPGGVPGLLSVLPAAQRGRNGDGWFRKPDGTTGPWGKYGASGLMLRHVDATGTERFLMVQRGPGISDPGKWQFPGGARDENESYEQGATREVVEELGFKTTDLNTARVHGYHTASLAGTTWAYQSIAADVPTQLTPDLSTHHARMETSDAKWMTRQEIDDLSRKGKLLAPLASGALQSNVLSLFPSTAPAGASVGRPGATPVRPARLVPGAAPPASPTPPPPPRPPHKPSTGRDLLPDTTTKNQLRQAVKKARVQYAGKSADDRLAAIGAMQGYDDVPTVVDRAEFTRLLATGNYVEMWRGVRGAGSRWAGPTRGGAISQSKTASQINEDLRSGPAYYGLGIFGNGYYFAESRTTAVNYSDGTPGSLVRVLLPKTAKVAQFDTVQREAKRASSAQSQNVSARYESGTLYDEGRYAAAKGFDAIEVPYGTFGASHVTSRTKSTYVVLNRSVLVVEEE